MQALATRHESLHLRLAHPGFEARVVAEAVTSSLEEAGLLLIASGHGATGSLVSMAGKSGEASR